MTRIKGYVKVLFPHFLNDKGVTETCWTKPMWTGFFKRSYVLHNMPFLTKGIALGDVLEVKGMDGPFPVFHKVIKRGGHSLLQVTVNSDEDMEDLKTIVINLKCQGEILSFSGEKIMSIDIPPKIDSEKVFYEINGKPYVKKLQWLYKANSET